jgi:two-component sensor histidine kinase
VAPDIATTPQAQERFLIRSSDTFISAVAQFEFEARQKLNQAAKSILVSIAELIQHKEPADWPVPQILEIVSTNAFRDLSLDLEERDHESLMGKQKTLEADVIEEKLQILGHRWAVYIHGHVQTRISAAALMIEEAQKKSNSEAIAQAITILDEMLSDPVAGFTSKSQTLTEEIDARLNPWRGILEIEVGIQPELGTIHSQRNQDIGEVLGEAISNAVRHGMARNIDVKIEFSEEHEVSITVYDDSSIVPAPSDGKGGLGTKIFNSVSDGRWKLSRDDETAQTKFRILVHVGEVGK